MSSLIKKSEVRKLLPRRTSTSHKGQNGRVLIIGGSLDYFGAPILAAMAALGTGADLVTLLVPECNFEVSRSYYPDFIVRKYPGNFINSRALDPALELMNKTDAVLIGPGVGEDPESLRVIGRMLQKPNCQFVLDAEAIPAIAQLGLPEPSENPYGRFTITPNRAEMDEITEGTLPQNLEEELSIVEDFAKKWQVNILLKNPQTAVITPGKSTRLNTTGNAGMTVGGSGDVLAGLVTSLIAQHLSPHEACVYAAFLLGTTGDELYKHKGHNFSATDLALELPYVMARL